MTWYTWILPATQKEDDRGRFQDLPLTKIGRRSDDRSDEWKGIAPHEFGRYWDVPTRSLRLMYPERSDVGRLGTVEKLEPLDKAGLVFWPESGGLPRYKIYAEMSEGERLSDILTTVAPVVRQTLEDAGWPDQVTEALLDTILRVSTNPGDIVLDPFSGSRDIIVMRSFYLEQVSYLNHCFCSNVYTLWIKATVTSWLGNG